MSNHTPQVETNLTVTRPLAVTVIVALATLAILLFVTSVSLASQGIERADLLYTIAAFVTFGLAFVPGKFLIEIAYEAVARK